MFTRQWSVLTKNNKWSIFLRGSKFNSLVPIRPLLVSGLILTLLTGCGNHRNESTSSQAGNDWPWYHGNPHGTHYSVLDQINKENVANLKVAWTFDSGDAFGEEGNQSDMQSNPLVKDGKMYFISPKGRLFCLDAAKGTQLWVFDPAQGEIINTKQRSRGIAFWSDGNDSRILLTFKNKLMAVNANSGTLITTFGSQGSVDLKQGLGRDPLTVSVANVSPGVIYKNLFILGSTGNTPGHIRAYDIVTGTMRWIFHTIPHPGEEGYETWPADAWKTAMGANAWSGLTLDPESGLVYVPLGSAGMGSKDFYGGDRAGDNLFGTSLVALEAATGKRAWHFQLVKHDLWDRDPPTPPTLINVQKNGLNIPALAQVTKAGVVFILDRKTGKPLYDLKEITPPPSDIPGEVSAQTQIMPTKPLPFARQQVTSEMLTQRTPEAHQAALDIFGSVSSRGPFDPPSLAGTLLLPGLDGGAEWGGAAYDPETGLIYINSNEMAWILKVKKQPPKLAGRSGLALYQNTCAACHGVERKGSPPEFPSLENVAKRLTKEQLAKQIKNGGGRMPGFAALYSDEDVGAIVSYLNGEVSAPIAEAPAYPSTEGDAYVFDGYTKFLDVDGYPAITPPWGTLSALNVNTGEYSWQIPLGEYPELAAKGMTNTGSENYGGAVVTKGGLLFIAATVYDNKFRAFDKASGKLLWETTLPAAGIATPATYSVKNKQYVVIGAGGGKNPKGRAGGSVVAFTLAE